LFYSCARNSRCSDASWSSLQIISIFYYSTSRLFPRRTSLDVLSVHCVTLLSDPPPRFIVSSTNISTSTYFTYDIGISPPGLFARFLYEVPVPVFIQKRRKTDFILFWKTRITLKPGRNGLVVRENAVSHTPPHGPLCWDGADPKGEITRHSPGRPSSP